MSDKWTNPLETVDDKQPKVEVEIVEDKKKAQPDSESRQPRQDNEDDDQFELSKRVQKRIAKLTRERKEAQEYATQVQNQWQNEKAQLVAEVQKARKSTNEAIVTGANTYEKQLKDKIALAKQAFETAYDTGDKAKLSDAQMQMSEAQAQLTLLQATKKPEQEVTQQQPRQEQQQQQRPQQQQYHPKAIDWAKEQGEWFGKDEEATALALGIDQKLHKEGWDPAEDEYYEELQKRIAKRFPELFDGQQEEEVEEEKPRQPQKRNVRSPVSGGSRTPASSKVRVTNGQIDMARRLGVGKEAYAKEQQKIDEAGDGYVTIL